MTGHCSNDAVRVADLPRLRQRRGGLRDRSRRRRERRERVLRGEGRWPTARSRHGSAIASPPTRRASWGTTTTSPRRTWSRSSPGWIAGTLIGAEETAQLETSMTWSPRTGFGGWLGTLLPADARTSMMHRGGSLRRAAAATTRRTTRSTGSALVEAAPGHRYAVAILPDAAPTGRARRPRGWERHRP